LAFEFDVSKKIAGDKMEPPYPQGFALPVKFFENAGRHCALSMPLLGKALEDQVQRCKGRLSVKTTLMLTEQLLRRLEYLHSLGIVHRDIKPENFMLGVQGGPREHIVFVIDFGLSKVYHDGKSHKAFRNKLSLTGTARYASLNAHKGIEQSRRDDLEALGYMILYFLRGQMPWSGLDARTKQEKFARIAQVKEETPLDSLCEGYPDCFKEYVKKTRALQYDERPDYHSYRKMFADAFQSGGFKEDYNYDWCRSPPNVSSLEPIPPWEAPTQPDDEQDDKVMRTKSGRALTRDACEKANARLATRKQEYDRIKATFEKFDKNHDGGIDKEEFKKVLGAIGIKDDDVSSYFEMADVNHDGTINLEEFSAWIQGALPESFVEDVYALRGDGDDVGRTFI
jgi:casein kinase I family protein HRR25